MEVGVWDGNFCLFIWSWSYEAIKTISSLYEALHISIKEPYWKTKYCQYVYWTNEYPNIFVSINRWQMNIQIYSPWKELTNIWKNEYIRLNIFEYIRISEYSSHTGPQAFQCLYITVLQRSLSTNTLNICVWAKSSSRKCFVPHGWILIPSRGPTNRLECLAAILTYSWCRGIGLPGNYLNCRCWLLAQIQMRRKCFFL